MNVLSLFDGISGAHMAMDRAGIKVDRYFASEIKDIAIKCAQENYPDTVQLGDVRKVSYKDGTLYWEGGEEKVKIDMICMGSPCQSFSIGIPDAMRIGLGDKTRSGLFYEGYRLIKEANPTYFLLENVRSMKDCDRDILTNYMGVTPILIDGADYGCAIRKRYYWTNISLDHMYPFQAVEADLSSKGYLMPAKVRKESALDFNDILESGYSDRTKARCLAVIDSRPNTTPIKMFHRYYTTGFTTLIFKSKEHYEQCVKEYEMLFGGKRANNIKECNYTGHVFDGVRYMNQSELEKCQAVPQGYTRMLNRNEAADVLGDGWQIDVIADILGGING